MNNQSTSAEALDSVKLLLPRLESIVLAAIPESGITCDRLEEVTGLAHPTASARIRDLAKRECIVDSGKRAKTRSGRNAIVWYRWQLT